MPELRKDYILDRYVIIASERAKRPHQFKSVPESKKVENCFFCPGFEHTTPPELGRVNIISEGWDIRYFPNKFPAVGQSGNPELKTDNDFFTYADALGYHEVIVETPDHEKELADLSEDHLIRILNIYKKRIIELSDLPNVNYVSVFKNHGKKAGTSLVHTHSQIIAYNMIPTIIQKKEKAITLYDSCPYCQIINIEKNSFRRCFENETMVAFTPYASRFPFEIWLLPKRHIINIKDFSQEETSDMAKILKKILIKLKSLNAPYNYYLHYGTKNLHFQMIITPRLSTWAGFELATETIINSMPPEKAAEFYRQIESEK